LLLLCKHCKLMLRSLFEYCHGFETKYETLLHTNNVFWNVTLYHWASHFQKVPLNHRHLFERHYHSLNCRELLAQWHKVTSEKTWSLSSLFTPKAGRFHSCHQKKTGICSDKIFRRKCGMYVAVLAFDGCEYRRDQLEYKGNHQECAKKICDWFVSKVLKWLLWEQLQADC
jgi:hypothetical protein